MPEEELEVVAPEVTEEVVETEEESIEEVKARLAKAEEIAENQRIRAEKAEKKAKEVPSTDKQGLATADLLAIMSAKVHEDDVERVERFAKSEGISIKDALKNSELKAILNVRQEERATAVATNIATTRRTATKPTGEALLEKASAGQLPDSDDEIAALMAAKQKAAKG